MQQVQPQHPGLVQNDLGHLRQGFLITGPVHHFIHGVPEDVHGGLDDENADHHTGHAVHHWKTRQGTDNSHQGPDGGEAVRPVMPGVRHEGVGVNLLGRGPGIPVHPLLDHNGDRRRHKGQHPGHRQVGIGPGQNGFQPLPADEQPGLQQDQGQGHRGHALKPLMSIAVLGIGLLAGNLNPDHNDQGGKHVRSRVNRVGDHGPRVGEHPRQKFSRGEDEIHRHTDQGDPHGQALGLLGGEGRFCFGRLGLQGNTPP